MSAVLIMMKVASFVALIAGLGGVRSAVNRRGRNVSLADLLRREADTQPVSNVVQTASHSSRL
jgi:hypothetical protein